MTKAPQSKPFPALNGSHHYLFLAAVLLLGLGLRFWHLDSKPLWLDEILTALFGLGHNYSSIPLEKPIPLVTFGQFLRYQPLITCPEIARNLVTDSSHPPLFFCGLYNWLVWLSNSGASLAWQLRSLPALLGTLAILFAYLLNRVAFGPKTGLLAATLMAVSPFGVYLSQEARHYTMPICVTLLALTCLVKLEQHLQKKYDLPLLWLGLWIVANGVGLYVHYFFLYIFIAQALTLGLSLGWQWQAHWDLPQKHLWHRLKQSFKGGLGIAAVLGIYAPLFVNMFQLQNQSNNQWLVFRPETLGDWFGPLLRQIVALTTMVLAIPLEKQPTWLVISMVIPALLVLGFISTWVFVGLKSLWQSKTHRGSLWVLLSFTIWTFLANLSSAYLLRRDLTLGFRYSFTYFPGVVALVAAGLGCKYPNPKAWQRWLAISAGLCGTIFVVHNLVFLKPFSPDQVSAKVLEAVPIVQQHSRQASSATTPPMLIAMVYDSPMRIAVGISYALELARSPHPKPDIYFAFINQNRSGSELLKQIRQQVQAFEAIQAKTGPLTLWLSGSYRTGKPHVNDAEIIEGLATQGCYPETGKDFLANQGIEFHLHRCKKVS